MRLPCGSTEVITGFSAVLMPLCLNINTAISTYLTANIDSLIQAYLSANVATSTGNVLSGFSTTGIAVYASGISSQWRAGFLPGSIYYSSGNIGIGTNSPFAKLDVIGDIQASGNMITNTPIAPNHAATKSYVDAAVVSAAGGGTSACTIRITCSASEVIKHTFLANESTFLESSIIRITPTTFPYACKIE